MYFLSLQTALLYSRRRRHKSEALKNGMKGIPLTLAILWLNEVGHKPEELKTHCLKVKWMKTHTTRTKGWNSSPNKKFHWPNCFYRSLPFHQFYLNPPFLLKKGGWKIFGGSLLFPFSFLYFGCSFRFHFCFSLTFPHFPFARFLPFS